MGIILLDPRGQDPEGGGGGGHKGGVFAQRAHSARTAPIITVIIQVTTLKTTPPAESCTINSKLKNSNI